MSSSNKNFSILYPLMQNYHVLRHPAIQKELEERAAAEARLLSDETSNKVEKEYHTLAEHDCLTEDTKAMPSESICSQHAHDMTAENDDSGISAESVEGSKIDAESVPNSNSQCAEATVNADSNLLAAQIPTNLNPQNASSNLFIPNGSIEVRKCYIPGVKHDNHSRINNEIENDKFHMKCFRIQPGKKGASKLDKEEKIRKLATLALFGHTFPRPAIAGVRPHAVAVNGFKRYHLKVLSKFNSNSLETKSPLSYSSLRAISKKNRKSKFPRICLSGKTASELLARSPQCTESSQSSDDEDYSNNNTQESSRKAQPNSKESKQTKTSKSKSLLSSLAKSNKSKTNETEDDEFACHYCDRTFTTKSGLGWHESYSHPRTCRICAKSFQFSIRWSRHKDPICNPCSEKFPQPKGSPIKVSPSLSQPYHPQQLTEKQKLYYRFKCDICSKLFGKRGRMIKHITNNHPSDMHKVDLAKFVATPKKGSNMGTTGYGGGHNSTAIKCTPLFMEQ